MRTIAVRGAGDLAELAPIAGALQVGGVLPEGFSLPPLVYTVLLVLGVLTVAAVLYVLSPPVRSRTIVALAPWMMAGGVVHAIRLTLGVPSIVEPLLGSPAVYATVAIVAGAVWVFAAIYEEMGPHPAERTLGIVGTGVVVTFVVFALIEGYQSGELHPLPPVVAVAGAVVAAAVTWIVLSIYFTDSAAVTSWAGATVVAAHALDGVTTAVGYDVLNAEEQTPLSARVLEAGELLPTAEYLGAGWLFVLVKLLLASFIVILFREWVRDEPHRARLFLAIVAAVGLGPGSHNLMLFALAG